VLTGHGRLTELLALADAPPLGTGLAHELAAERTSPTAHRRGAASPTATA
jgi:hypothetical protein